MELRELINQYSTDNRTRQLVSWVQVLSGARIHLNGLVGSQDAFVAAGVYWAAPQPHIFILNNKEEAAYFQNTLKNLLQNKDVLFFPDSFKKPGSIEEVNKNNVLLRTETVSRLHTQATTGELLVTYPQAFFEKVVNTKVLDKNTIFLKINEQSDIDFIIELLVTYGFERTDFVYEPGQFSVRGGILDIYSFGNDLPYRVELFGNEVESIRIFDPLTQLSVRKLAQVTIVPNIQTHFSGQEKASLFKILPPNSVVWVKDLSALLEINTICYDKALQAIGQLQKQGIVDGEEVFKGDDPASNFLSTDALRADLLEFSIIEFGSNSLFPDAETIQYRAKPQPSFNKNFELLIKDFKHNEANDITNLLFVDTPRQVNRLDQIFTDLKAHLKYTPLVTIIHEGFIDLDLQLACYTDHQIFDRFHKYNIKQGYSKDKAITIQLLRSLQPGDYVTHIDHGVGIFSGLSKIEVGGKTQEVIRIVYKDNDLLYVGINSLHKVSKYMGKDSTPPKINKLGSDAWETVKRKAKQKIKDIAQDLIKLYAKRKAVKGYQYNRDTYLQTELEASFIYEDTPDQLKSTLDVKRDMEKPYPMDRLVCGDVGFGKTEIAIRAAAKAVADSKQVAILVPTTILALQHYKTFTDRLKDFPCTIDYLNRFKTAKQKTETLQRLAEGKIDILIGTHAILGGKVKFKDLGLLIIDEEQKFGVAAKEKLRNFKINVDTLTLTATPIPRTLQFSLLGARDLSIINTAPPNRQPVETEVISFDEVKIREAINYEVYRGGQVFFVHNRVKDLIEVANMIMRLCPDVSVGMAHGQMDNDQLEERMLGFIEGKYDVLISTNIVEAGLDVPNANTMIINNAHWFGLSDLHQLRGRVGRSNRKAFCYLISPALFTLPEDARRRLKAIEQFAELGSGFQIAMRDLDIRGAGNLLGGEQSGFIADIGYDTYHKILDETIRELKHNEFKDLFEEENLREQSFVGDCQIDTDLEMLIPDDYVGSSPERLALYTRLDNIETEEELAKFKAELADRFGIPPKEVKELFEAVRLRWMAKKLGFDRILFKGRKLRCYFIQNQNSAYYQSPTFLNIIQHIHKQMPQATFKQSNESFMLVFEQIKSMSEARQLLTDINAAVSG